MEGGVKIEVTMKRDVDKLLVLTTSKGKDLGQVLRQLELFKRRFSNYTEEGRRWEDNDPTSKMLLQSRIFEVIADLTEELVFEIKSGQHLFDDGVEVVSTAISILGNYLSVRRQKRVSEVEWKRRLVDILNELLRIEVVSKNGELINRTFRLLSNLLIQGAIDPLVVARIGLFDTTAKVILNGDGIIAQDANALQNILKSILRFISICVQKKDAKMRFNSMTNSGVELILSPLAWKTNILPVESLHLIMKLVQCLVGQNLGAISRETLKRFCLAQETLTRILTYYKDSEYKTDSELVALDILKNLLANEQMSNTLLALDLCKILHAKLSESDDPSILARHLRLVVQLHETHQRWASMTLHSAVYWNEVCGSTVKALRMQELSAFHPTILAIYTQLPKTLFLPLVKEGLMDELVRRLDEAIGLRSIDDVVKQVRTAQENHVDIRDSLDAAHKHVTPPVQAVYCPPTEELDFLDGPTSKLLLEGNFLPTFDDDNSLEQILGQDDPMLEDVEMDGTACPVPNTGEKAPKQDLKLIFRILRILLAAPEVRRDIVDLLPTFLYTLFDIGFYHDIRCEMTWIKGEKDTPCVVVVEPSGNVTTAEDMSNSSIFVDLHYLVGAVLLEDNQLIFSFVDNKVALILQKMRWMGSDFFAANLGILMDMMAGRGSTRCWDLSRSFIGLRYRRESGLNVEPIDIKIRTTIAVLFDDVASWLADSDNMLLRGMETKDACTVADLMEDICVALITIGNRFRLKNWSDVKQLIQDNQLLSLKHTEPNFVSFDNSDGNCVSVVLKGGAILRVKKEALVEASEVFERMLVGEFVEAKSNRIELPDFSIDSFFMFLLHLNAGREAKSTSSGPVTLEDFTSLEVIFELLRMSHQFMAMDLYQNTLNSIIGNLLSPSTVIPFYKLSLEIPEFPCDVVGGCKLTSRTVFLHYLIATDSIHPLAKVTMLQEMVAMDVHLMADLLRELLKEIRATIPPPQPRA